MISYKYISMRIKKLKIIILTVIPIPCWVLLVIALIMRFRNNENLIFSNLILNYIAIFIFTKINVILHEVGHLLSAKIVRGEPRRMVLGKGHEVVKFVFFGIKIVLNNSFQGGFAIANFNNSLNRIKLRYLVYISGGILINILSAVIIFCLFDFNLNSLLGTKIDLASDFIASNILLLIPNLIPFSINYLGVKIPNDILSILRLPFKKFEVIKNETDTNILIDAYEYFELKEYDKAIEKYETYLKTNNDQEIVKVNLSIMYLKKGNCQKSLEISKKVESFLEEKKYIQYKAYVYNNLAWIYLVQHDIVNADKYSDLAININKKEKSFQSTRSSVLIEKGEVETGINYLGTLFDSKFPNSQTITAAMYLSYGYHLLQNIKEKKKYYDFVSLNVSKLDIDEKFLWDSLQDRMMNQI